MSACFIAVGVCRFCVKKCSISAFIVFFLENESLIISKYNSFCLYLQLLAEKRTFVKWPRCTVGSFCLTNDNA